MPAHALAPVPGQAGLGLGLGFGTGTGSGSGFGFWFPTGLVLIELGLTGMGFAKHTRSAIRIRTAPPMDPLRYPDPNRSANGCL